MNANHAPNDPVSDDRADSDDGIDLLDDDFTMTWPPIDGDVDMTIVNQAISNMWDEYVVQVIKPIKIIDMNYLS